MTITGAGARLDATVQGYSALVVTPDNARDVLVGSPDAPGLLRAPASTLSIQMEKLDPQTSRGVIPATRDTAARGDGPGPPQGGDRLPRASGRGDPGRRAGPLSRPRPAARDRLD